MNADLVKAFSDLTEPLIEGREEAEELLITLRNESCSSFEDLTPEGDWMECPSTGPIGYDALFTVVELTTGGHTYWITFDGEMGIAYSFTPDEIAPFCEKVAEIVNAYLVDYWGEDG